MVLLAATVKTSRCADEKLWATRRLRLPVQRTKRHLGLSIDSAKRTADLPRMPGRLLGRQQTTAEHHDRQASHGGAALQRVGLPGWLWRWRSNHEWLVPVNLRGHENQTQPLVLAMRGTANLPTHGRRMPLPPRQYAILRRVFFSLLI